MTPNLAIVRIQTPHGNTIPLWIPLFLLWIPVILLSPLILLVLLGFAIGGRVSFLRIVTVLWDLLCALPGTHVRVTAEGSHVTVRIL